MTGDNNAGREYRSDVPPDVARRLLSQAEMGLWRARPIYYGDVDPFRPDENFIEGFDLYRGNRRVRVYLTDLTPDEAFRYRRALVDRMASRISRVLQPFLEADGSFRDDVTITPVYRQGRPVQLVISRPGVRPVRLSARDFIGLLHALRDKNEVILHGQLKTDEGIKHFWIIGNRDIMELMGLYVQQRLLPLDYFTQRGNVIFLNADAIAQPLFQKKVKFRKVDYVKRSIWGWSP
ncbi:TPA: hypothetical protein EYP13_04555 [Candidatus Micrarchaeota archaeon]|nr:hypothetical protein [Candidatus Micrarchaeota archaeon]